MSEGGPIRARVLGLAFAGPSGLKSTWGPGALPLHRDGEEVSHDDVPVEGTSRSLRLARADPGVMEAAASNLPPRVRRYLGRNARLGLAAVERLLADHPLPEALVERAALYAATFRGSWDPTGTLAILEAAGAGRPGSPLRAAAALAAYRSRRTAVQYLLAMETAMPGQISAALRLRGPVHAVTTPGAAGGAQSLARSVRTVAGSDAPAAVALGVLTIEDAPAVAEHLERAGGGGRTVVECAAAALLGPASGPGGTHLLTVEEERFDPEGTPTALRSGPWFGPAGPLVELARGLASGSAAGTLAIRGAWGHRQSFRWEAVE